MRAGTHGLKLGCVALAVLLLATAAGVRADVWAWVDDRGVAHFASHQVDPRYELFYRGDGTRAGQPATADAETLMEPALPQDTRRADRLRAFFEVSPAYKSVRPTLNALAREHGLDEHLLVALIATESGFDSQAVSPRGAIGLMQVMPDTARRFGVKALPGQTVEQRLRQPSVNLQAGVRYLAFLLRRFQGDTGLALAAYNAGEGAVDRAGRQVPDFPETQNYVRTVTQLHALLRPPQAVTAAVTARQPQRPPGSIPGRGNLPQSLAAAPPQALPVIERD